MYRGKQSPKISHLIIRWKTEWEAVRKRDVIADHSRSRAILRLILLVHVYGTGSLLSTISRLLPSRTTLDSYLCVLHQRYLQSLCMAVIAVIFWSFHKLSHSTLSSANFWLTRRDDLPIHYTIPYTPMIRIRFTLLYALEGHTRVVKDSRSSEERRQRRGVPGVIAIARG